MRQINILVAEDDVAINRLLRAILQNEGWIVSSVWDGEEAVKYAKDSQPDLVILDMIMPKLTGLEVCRQITSLSRTPVIMVSATTDLEMKAQCRTAGAQAFVNKPFSAHELVNHVKTVLHLELPG